LKTTHNEKSPLPKRSFLFVSRWGEILDIAIAAKEEGHSVKFHIADKSSREIGYGFLKKVTNWQQHIDWADVIVFDYTGFGKECDDLRAAGK
jgi:phosphoribosylamine---glycine ligase